MKRRTALKYTTLLTGVTLSGAFVTGYLSGCQPDKTGPEYQPILLSKERYQFLQQLTDVLLPETDTPGAVEFGVPELLESIAGKCYTSQDQKSFEDQLTLLYQTLEGNEFVESNADKKQTLVHQMEKEASNNSELNNAYQSIKSKIITCYLGTEYVGTNLLNYLPVPGEYEPCIPASSLDGKAWTYG